MHSYLLCLWCRFRLLSPSLSLSLSLGNTSATHAWLITHCQSLHISVVSTFVILACKQHSELFLSSWHEHNIRALQCTWTLGPDETMTDRGRQTIGRTATASGRIRRHEFQRYSRQTSLSLELATVSQLLNFPWVTSHLTNSVYIILR